MPIEEALLKNLKIEEFTPARIVNHLKIVPDFFYFLKSKENVLGRTRGIVTFITSVTIWAFKKKFKKTLREIPFGMLDKLWESFKDLEKEWIFDIPYKVEPHVWNYFLSLVYIEAQRDGWEKHELLRAATVYGPILIGSCWVFYPEKELINVERLWRNH